MPTETCYSHLAQSSPCCTSFSLQKAVVHHYLRAFVVFSFCLTIPLTLFLSYCKSSASNTRDNPVLFVKSCSMQYTSERCAALNFLHKCSIRFHFPKKSKNELEFDACQPNYIFFNLYIISFLSFFQFKNILHFYSPVTRFCGDTC